MTLIIEDIKDFTIKSLSGNKRIPNYIKAYQSQLTNTIIDFFDRGIIPVELNWIKELLYEIKLDNLKVASGIYFLFKGDRLQYIGQTINVLSRTVTHIREKDFDKALFLPVVANTDILLYIEKCFIEAYHPPLNKTCRTSWVFNSEKIIDALIQARLDIDKARFDFYNINQEHEELCQLKKQIVELREQIIGLNVEKDNLAEHIRNMVTMTVRLKAEVEDLAKLKKIKKYWADRELPDLVA